MILALLVMMNNYFHDLAVAFLFASTLLGHLALREWPAKPPRRLLTTLNKVAIWSLVWVIVGGTATFAGPRAAHCLKPLCAPSRAASGPPSELLNQPKALLAPQHCWSPSPEGAS